MGKLTKEDIILLFLEDPEKLTTELWDKNVPKSDEIRTLICELGNARCAYWYAELIDKKPTDETRTVACKDSKYAYWYAHSVDKKPTDETRTAACKKSGSAYWYARIVDKKPTDETREAAYKSSDCKERYIKWENSLKKI